MADMWFCLVDVKYLEEDTYTPRHNKMIVRANSLPNVLEFVENHIGEAIDSITMTWAGKKGYDCKQELVFSESEFEAFDLIKNIIEDDHSYADYIKAEEEYERSKQNR